jgi:hypothetical protein
MKYQIKDTIEEITNPITGKKYTRMISPWHNTQRTVKVFFVTLDYNTDDLDGEQISILFHRDAIDIDYTRQYEK